MRLRRKMLSMEVRKPVLLVLVFIFAGLMVLGSVRHGLLTFIGYHGLVDYPPWLQKCPQDQYVRHTDKGHVNCGQKEVITASGLFSTNSDKLECPSYLPNYQPPCWREVLNETTTYLDHPFLVSHSFSKVWRMKLTEAQEAVKKDHSEGIKTHLHCLPSVYLIGHIASGVPYLTSMLSLHPQVHGVDLPQTRWWSDTSFTAPLNKYVQLFDLAARAVESTRQVKGQCTYHPGVIVDASALLLSGNGHWSSLPDNLLVEGELPTEPCYIAADYIQHLVPNAKILVVLMNPVIRLRIAYSTFVNSKGGREAFHDWALMSLTIFKECLQENTPRSCVYKLDKYFFHTSGGIYSVLLEDWIGKFGANNILIIHGEDDLIGNTWDTAVKVIQFLELDPLPGSAKDKLLKLKKPSLAADMLPETAKMLEEFYQPHNEYLAKLLKDKRFLWQDQP